MANLDDATKPVDTSNMTLAEPSKVSGPAPDAEQAPGLNPFFRCPMPQINAYPDSLRQFFHTGVPQTRVIPAPPSTVIGATGATGETGAKGASVIASPTIKNTTGQPKRETIPLTTGTLAPGATETGTVPLGKTFSLMSITASQPCRVRLYSSTGFRTADIAIARSLTQVPTPYIEHGVIFDWNTQDSVTITSADWDGGITNFHFDNVTTATQLLSDEHPIFSHPILWTPGPGDVVRLDCLAPSPTTVSAVFSNGVTSLGDAGSVGSGVGVLGPARIIPVGTTQINYTLHNSTFSGAQWAVQVDIARNPVITYPNYPVSFVCSPETPGSDKNAFPSGDIAYLIDNLGAFNAAITVNFEILREEK